MGVRRAARVSLCLILVTLCAFAATAPVSASPTRWAVCGGWRYVPVEDGRGSVTDVAVVSPTEAWAITEYRLSTTSPQGEGVVALRAHTRAHACLVIRIACACACAISPLEIRNSTAARELVARLSG